MFGFFSKNILKNAIINATENLLPQYKSNIIRYIKEADANELDEQEFFSIRKQFLDDVANSVFSTFRVSSPTIYQKIMLNLLHPYGCGYDINVEDGISAGAVFAICYHAIENKPAPTKYCIRLNHLQHELMEQVLEEIDSEYNDKYKYPKMS